jgi:acyl carrier protein
MTFASSAASAAASAVQRDRGIDRARHILSVALFLPVEQIGEHADLRSLERMDSLSFEMVVAEVERALGHEIEPLRLLQLSTVRDLGALLENAP